MAEESTYDYSTPVPCSNPDCQGDAIFTMIMQDDILDDADEMDEAGEDVVQSMIYTCILCQYSQVIHLYAAEGFDE